MRVRNSKNDLRSMIWTCCTMPWAKRAQVILQVDWNVYTYLDYIDTYKPDSSGAEESVLFTSSFYTAQCIIFNVLKYLLHIYKHFKCYTLAFITHTCMYSTYVCTYL